jgi:hypothetical protein
MESSPSIPAQQSVQTAVNVKGSINDFLQYDIKNTSTGNAAQAGYSATADTGSLTSVFSWMGINNSTFYSPSAYNVGGPLDVSFLGTGNDMFVANGTSGKNLYFLTGGTSNVDEIRRMTITGLLRTGGSRHSQRRAPTATFAVQGGAGQIVDFATSTGGSAFHLTSQGYIGLGTTTPYAQLSVAGGNLVIATSSTGATPGDLFLPKYASLAGSILAVDPTGKVFATTTGVGNFWSNSGANTTLTTGTKLGIGSTTPWAQLSVNPNALGSGVPEFAIGSSTATHCRC